MNKKSEYLREKEIIKLLNTVINAMNKLQQMDKDFCGTYIDKNAFNNSYGLMLEVKEVIKNDIKQ